MRTHLLPSLVVLWVAAILAQGAHAQLPPAATCDLDQLDVVDAHSHFFNLDYLPEKGMFYSLGIPWPVAPLVADFLHNATPRPADGKCDLLKSYSRKELEGFIATELFAGHSTTHFLLRVYKPALRRALIRYALARADPNRSSGNDVQDTVERRYEKTSTKELLLELIYVSQLRGEGDPDSLYALGTTLEELKGAVAALCVMMSDEQTIVEYAKRAFPQVNLFVHHMMDMERPYNDVPPLRFYSQIIRVAELDRWNHGLLRFTVAYDPFRRNADLVMVGYDKDALGAKFYTPSGSRPANNTLPLDKPGIRSPFTASWAQRRQWEARYGGDWKAGRIDELNRATFQEAARRGKSIFSHHNKSGFEVGPGYGKEMGAPCHWQTILDELDPALTVIIAHAGGTEEWFGDDENAWGTESEPSYALQAYNMCVSYENVYCDFGGAWGILNDKASGKFVKRLERLFEKQLRSPPTNPIKLCDKRTEVEPQYHLYDKILYGSDWLVSANPDRDNYLSRFHEAFKKSKALKERCEEFFGANAREAFF